jgi:hypothetical protein
MDKFYYIVEEILEFGHEDSLDIPRFVTHDPEVAFEWIKNNLIFYDPEAYGNYHSYRVTVHKVCPSYIIKHYKEPL